MSVPIAASPGRSGFGPQLALSYNSGTGNGPFGIGWELSASSITRKTDKGLPQYFDVDESDVFILSGAEDLVPVLTEVGGKWEREQPPPIDPAYDVRRYRPRIEGLFARIERWTNKTTGISHWRSLSKDNVTTIYGAREDSRIADTRDPTRIFSWQICESFDDKGNAALYRYKSEDDANIDHTAPCEKNRLISKQFSQRYLKTICYGNRTPRIAGEDLTIRNDWLFEIVFDYGEHDALSPATQEVKTWPLRPDPFSSYRATFEVRTYRRCQRVLMFHQFADELGGTVDCLVRSTELEYKDTPIASFVSAIMQSGYVQRADSSYFKKSFPKLEFKYTEAHVDETVHEVDPDSIQNLPAGVDETRYRWVDLDSEGLTGVLTQQAESWYYKRSLGNGTFGALESVAPRPLVALNRGQVQLLDLAGEGRLDVVQFDGPVAGFYERTADGNWEGFQRFKAVPNINTGDPNVRFIDVTGDGRPDILISEDTVFTWYESSAKQGFGSARRASKAWDEEKGPKLVFSDPTHSIYVADMSGDGLADIVRIRPSEVAYWPNLGYGRFGAKVTMGNAPIFESPDQFDPRRIRLADIDGSGNNDIVYVGARGISLYFNQSGNSWSPPQLLTRFPRTDSLKTVAVTDLLGNGTACLVWSSPLATDVRQPMRYIDLMGGQKPHLVVHVTNNMGAETDVQYAASTKYYLQDRLAGRPWVTKLPFPVHVIERLESRDLVSNTKLVSTYRYRHGYFDGVEREFRGFAYVEQRDTESVVDVFDLPPAVTKTWFHTGAFLEGKALETYFKDPLNQEYFTGDIQAAFLPDTDFPTDLTYEELREGARALKGGILRQEIYADDGTSKAALPYSVSQRSYELICLQPQGPNRFAVFLTHPSQTIDYHYERNLADPRISHTLTLEVDDYSNVLKSVAIGYQRRVPLFDEQKTTLAILRENQYTNAVLQDDAYRTPLPLEAKTYELTDSQLTGATPLSLSSVKAIAAAANEIAYETQPTPGQSQKRSIGRMRTLYRKNDLSALLPIGQLESLALPGESYKLALTPGLIDVFQSRASHSELTAIITGSEGRYRDLDGNGLYWIASGRVFYSPTLSDSAPQELAFAQPHFFLPHRFEDSFGNNTTVAYDGKYNLVAVSTRDAVGNEVMADIDYRVLQPKQVTDSNGNRSEARFDALGLPVGAAIRGKATGTPEGDSFNIFEPDLTPAQIQAFFATPDPRALAIAYLGTATSRIVYDLEQVPVCGASIARETHVSALGQGATTKVQVRVVYSDGFGREAQSRMQAEPGPMDPNDPGSVVLDPRWVATGAKVYNNKGKPVRQYEPFFSATPAFGIERQGVSSTLFYDPPGRVVATLHPNNTFEKVVFDPWQQTSWDVNDTVSLDPKTDADVGDFFKKLPDADYLPTWYQQRAGGGKGPNEKAAADKAAKHANTPTVAHFDALGRPFLMIADNGTDSGRNSQKYRTRTLFDVQGKQRQVTDALDRIVMRYDYDLLGSRIHQISMEAGERWLLNDASGRPMRSWNSRQYAFRTEYDALHRPLRSFVRGGDPSEPNPNVLAQEILFERVIYGDSADTGLTDVQQRQANLRGKAYRHFDGAGVVTTDQYDFKGNPLRSSRQFATDYRTRIDWSQSPTLESATFISATIYDGLSRAVSITAPEGSIYRPSFNEANLIETIDVNLRGVQQSGQPLWTSIVTNIDYNAKGQRTLIQYANSAQTTYEYDDKTFQLADLKTTRVPPAGPPDIGGQLFNDPAIVQDLHYTYDPAGNITRIEDAALQTVFYNNQQIDPVADYTYDAIYQLISAAGREHVGQSAFQFSPGNGNYRDYPFVGAALSSDLQALRNYTEQYDYDPVGNFNRLAHQSSSGSWTRSYTYNEASRIEPAKKNNRLSQTLLGTAGPGPETYLHDSHGNMIEMPHLPSMQWDIKDQLSVSARQVVNAGAPESTFYVYDASGKRARKVTVRQNGTRKSDRIYLDAIEIYREYGSDGSSITLERESLHVMDDRRRIVLVETLTVENGSSIAAPTSVQRYQFSNHLGSASVELDVSSGLISYEEYLPYGGTAYQAGRSAAELSLKRFRYTSKERDEETGFAYHGARYLSPWLGRWCASDPLGLGDGVNTFAYVSNSPVRLRDMDGMQGTDSAPVIKLNLTPEQEQNLLENTKMAEKIEADMERRANAGEFSKKAVVPPPPPPRKKPASPPPTIMRAAQPPPKFAAAPANVPSIGPAIPLPDDAVLVEEGNRSTIVSESYLEDTSNVAFFGGGELKDGVRVYKLVREEPDPDMSPEAQAAAHAAWYDYKFAEIRTQLGLSASSPLTSKPLAGETQWGAPLVPPSSGKTPLMTYGYGYSLSYDLAQAGQTLVLGKYPSNVQYVRDNPGTFTIDRPWGWTRTYNAGGVRGALDAEGKVLFTSKEYTGTFGLEAVQVYTTRGAMPRLVE